MCGCGFVTNTDCVCCKNPWSKKASDEFSMMCGDCLPVETKTDAAVDPANFDFTKSPASNFFEYCNGGWQAANPIPPEYPNWNTFLELHTQNQQRLKDLLAELSKGEEKLEGSSTTRIKKNCKIIVETWCKNQYYKFSRKYCIALLFYVFV